MTDIDRVVSQWVRLGVMFNIDPATQTPDLERLLLATARVAPSHPRLFILAVTWLTLFGDYIATDRLSRLVREDLEDEHRPTLGLLLDSARAQTPKSRDRFDEAIALCSPARQAAPLFEVERQNPTFIALAEKRASALSRYWGRWAAETELKFNAVRPAEWVAKMNPLLGKRALIEGDMTAPATCGFGEGSAG